jgi:hypothetical protein
MKTQQEISDRLEIKEALIYSTRVVDTKDWDHYEGAFTDDAHLDYTALGMEGHTPKECLAGLQAAAPIFPQMQHLLTNTTIASITGDTATAHSIVFAPCVMPDGRTVFTGAWYHDTLKRTPAGWKVAERVAEHVYSHNFPEDFVPPAPE